MVFNYGQLRSLFDIWFLYWEIVLPCKQTGYLVPYVTFELPNRLFDMCYMDIKYLYGHLNSQIGYLTCAIWTYITYMDIWTA